MRKLYASIAIILSFILFGQLALGNEHTIQVSYYDLQPSARYQVDCLADNIYFESRAESESGQQAVALVTMNRVSSGRYPTTICEVVKQKVQATCQFSWWCDATARAQSLSRRFVQTDEYEKIRNVALEVYLNYEQMHDITKGALFYHAVYVDKTQLGMRNIKQTVKIGQHIFYRNSI